MKRLTTDLEKIKSINHGFYTRHGGVSGGLYASLNCGLKTDDPFDNIMQNRARVAESLGLAPEQFIIAKQVHGIAVAVADKPWKQSEAPEADAIVTATPGIGIGVLTADCVPLLFADKKARVIGAAHAGWKGALNGVAGATVAAMQKLGAKVENIAVAIGPCIRQPSYEVKDDFVAAFVAQDATNMRFFGLGKPGHRMFDLPAYVTHQLGSLGIQNIYDTRQDTAANEGVFFSNRRAFLRGEKGFGLQVSAIALR